jgi:acetylornithine deacetylase
MMAGEFVRLLETVWDELCADADPRFDPPHSTVQANMIEGGSASNILARDARITWEYRALPDRDASAIVARVRERAEREILPKYLGRAPEARLETVLHAAYPGLVMDEASPAVRLALAITGANHAESVSYGTEAGHFQGVGIPAVICGPGSIDQAHKADEWVELAQLKACEDFLAKVIARAAV